MPAALYSAFAGELIRSRTFRRRYAPDRFGPAGVLASTNTILHQRQLEEYYCTLCYAVFDLKAVRISKRSAFIRFTDEMEEAMSSQRHLDLLCAPVVVLYGTNETPEFQRQSRGFAAASIRECC